MKEVSKYIILALLVVLAAALSGCGKKQPEASEYYVFYVNKDNTKILPVPLETEALEPETLISEMILKLCQEQESVDFKRPIPKNVELISWSLEKRQLYLNFGTEYSNMDRITEVLCRAAFVRTLTQLEEIDCVSFYVDDVPLMDEKGNPVGMMMAENFVENPGEQINSIQTANITLYFSNQKGDKLVEEVQEEVHYSSNISMEKLVMERLLKGPSNKECISAIPAGTKLVGFRYWMGSVLSISMRVF